MVFFSSWPMFLCETVSSSFCHKDTNIVCQNQKQSGAKVQKSVNGRAVSAIAIDTLRVACKDAGEGLCRVAKTSQITNHN